MADHMTAEQLRAELAHVAAEFDKYADMGLTARQLRIAVTGMADDIRGIAARLSGMAAVPEWQPIETAPKGRKILVAYRNELGNWRRVMATYYLAETLEMEEGSFDWDTESGFAPAGWYEEFENGEHAYPISATLELWCELPALPAAPEVPGHG